MDTDYNSHTITAKLRRNQFRPELVGRYSCSETINDKNSETSIYVFIQGISFLLSKKTEFFKNLFIDGNSVFTRKTYPKVLQHTGIHFFNLPCQTTSWYPKMSCPMGRNCKTRQCSLKERQANELKCNIPICDGQELCIPVYYTPPDLKAAVCVNDF